MPVKEKHLNRREREKIAHRHEILEAAERVFVKSGGDHATVEEIAKEAEFAVGTIYRFFESKDALFSQVMVKIAEDFIEDLEREVLSEPNSMDAISKLITMRLRHAEEHSGFLHVFRNSQPLGNISPDESIPENCQTLYDTYLTKAAKLFERAKSEGLIRSLDPLYAVLSLEGSINAFSAYWQRQDISLSLAEQIDQVNRNCLDCLLIPNRENNN